MSQDVNFRKKAILKVLESKYPNYGSDIRITDSEIIITPEIWPSLAKDSLYTAYSFGEHRKGGYVGTLFGFKIKVVRRELLDEAATSFNPSKR